jgi:hypothetical protein
MTHTSTEADIFFPADLVKYSSHIKSHLAEPVVTVAIQNCLSNINVLRFLDILVQRAQLKVSVLRMARDDPPLKCAT